MLDGRRAHRAPPVLQLETADRLKPSDQRVSTDHFPLPLQFTQLQPTPQAQSGLQAQAVSVEASWQPQLHSAPEHDSQAQRWLVSSIMGGSPNRSGLRTRAQFRGAPRGKLECSGYSGRTLAGDMPNIFLKVRDRCAESAKPPACAASVSEFPAT